MNDLRNDLESLLEHPGWQWFTNQVHAEWGAGGKRFDGFINSLADSRADDALTLRQIQQIAVARREILRAILAPSEELAKLTARDQMSQARDYVREQISSELIGQSRRGGL